MSEETVVKVENVRKKFCRNLKRALYYGVRDIAGELLGLNGTHHRLRPREFWAVDDVSLQVKRGECLGLIGANGAGKSTLLKLLNGLIKPDQGKIVIRGRTGALIELGTGFHPILSARENIYVNAAVLGMRKKEVDRRLDDIIEFAELREFVDMPVQSYSSGMKVRLGFAVAAQFEPELLLVDEVLAVGDIGFRLKCQARIRELLDAGTSIIVVSHSMVDIGNLCQNVIWLDRGRIRSRGESNSIALEYERHLVERTVRAALGNRAETPGVLNPSAGVRITNVAVGQASDPLSAEVRPDEPLEIAVTVDCRRVFDRLAFTYAFRNPGQILYYGQRVSIHERVRNPGRYLIRLTIPPRRLLPGVHILSCALARDRDYGANIHYIPQAAIICIPGTNARGKVGYAELNPECTVLQTESGPHREVNDVPAPNLVGVSVQDLPRVDNVLME